MASHHQPGNVVPLHRGVRPVPDAHLRGIFETPPPQVREASSPSPAPELYTVREAFTQLERDGHRYADAAAFAGLLAGLVIGFFLGAGLLAAAQWLVEMLS